VPDFVRSEFDRHYRIIENATKSFLHFHLIPGHWITSSYLTSAQVSELPRNGSICALRGEMRGWLK
jgi:hypothetical protein